MVNRAAAGAQRAAAAISADPRFVLHDVGQQDLERAVSDVARREPRRILIAGGDGTLRTAASVLFRSSSSAEIAVLPAGTLNHFAASLGIPGDAAEALDVAATGAARHVDAGLVNGNVFLNTSSVGAYVRFVRQREQLERRFGYALASVIAATRVAARLRRFRVELEVDGELRQYRTPLVFVGVGERQLTREGLSSRVAAGASCLTVLVVHRGSLARMLYLGAAAAVSGVRGVAGRPEVDAYMEDRCSVDLVRPRGFVALDGETLAMQSPLEYRIARDCLAVVVPREALPINSF